MKISTNMAANWSYISWWTPLYFVSSLSRIEPLAWHVLMYWQQRITVRTIILLSSLLCRVKSTNSRQLLCHRQIGLGAQLLYKTLLDRRLISLTMLTNFQTVQHLLEQFLHFLSIWFKKTKQKKKISENYFFLFLKFY